MKQIDICIPTWERYELTLESFSDVYDDERIANIIIVDDCSSIEIFNKLKSICDCLPKVSLYRNVTNQDCYSNKMIAASYAKSSYIVIFDSDNKLNKEYIDKIYNEEWYEKRILAPVFARPTFDYRQFSNMVISKENARFILDEPMFTTALNTMNFFINKERYLETFDRNFNPVTADSIYINYLWLKNGGEIKFVDGMEYDHLVHQQSHYINNVAHTPSGLNEILIENIRNLR